MLIKTRGVVLTHYKFGESSLVLHIFTEELGMQSYLVNGVWKKNSKLRPALFQPLTLLHLEVYSKPGGRMQRIREAALAQPYNSILNQVAKSSVAFFMAELFHRTLRIEVADEVLFAFVLQQTALLEGQLERLAWFPVRFLRDYSVVMGIGPQVPERPEERIFDLQAGLFVAEQPPHPFFFNREESSLFRLSLLTDYHDFSRAERQFLTDAWVRYFQLHFESVGHLKTLKVLHEVFA